MRFFLSCLILAVSVYPAILTTHVRVLEQRSQTVIYLERLLSVYIADLHCNAIALVDSVGNCPGWELACALCMPPSLEALSKGEFFELDDDPEVDRGIIEYDPFAEGEEDDGAFFAPTGHSRKLMHAIEAVIRDALEDLGNDDDAPGVSQRLTSNADRQPSYIHELLDDSVPQPSLDAALMPPHLYITSPEPLWLPHIRAHLDKLLSALVTSAFQLLWQPVDGTPVIKPADLLSLWQLGGDHKRKLHLLRRLVAIIFQEYALRSISPAGSYESAAQDGGLISQGRR
jgi:hypothetical protein